MTKRTSPSATPALEEPAPSKYIQKMARAIIGDTMAHKCIDYGSGGIVCVIGSYNTKLGRLSSWGTGKTWAQALRAVRRTADANKVGNPRGGLEDAAE